MSYSLALKNGDLDTSGSRVSIVQGVEKLKQDLDLWMREVWRVDRFHPGFGSILDNFIGSVVSETAKNDVQAEVLRVLSNYQSIQLKRVRATPEKFSPAEILETITSVDARVDYDKVWVDVRFVTAAGIRSTASLEVNA